MTDLPRPCQEALQAIEISPLELSDEVLRHLKTCHACSEARVLWLSLESSPEPLAPTGYFETLSTRILLKLPPARRHWARSTRFLLGAAAGFLVLAAGLGGYMAGSLNKAAITATTRPPESIDPVAETPFQSADDDLSHLLTLSPEEGKELIKRLQAQSKPTK